MLNFLDEDGAQEMDNQLCTWHTDSEWQHRQDYVRVCSVVDSGAAEHVSARGIAPDVPVRPSPGSQRGQHYVAANGSRLPNEGQQRVEVITEDGGRTEMVFQTTDVQRPLCSVAKLCDRGNRVTFGRNGGVIHNLRTSKLTPFHRQGGIYTLGLWVKQSEATGFPRPS